MQRCSCEGFFASVYLSSFLTRQSWKNSNLKKKERWKEKKGEKQKQENSFIIISSFLFSIMKFFPSSSFPFCSYWLLYGLYQCGTYSILFRFISFFLLFSGCTVPTTMAGRVISEGSQPTNLYFEPFDWLVLNHEGDHNNMYE